MPFRTATPARPTRSNMSDEDHEEAPEYPRPPLDSAENVASVKTASEIAGQLWSDGEYAMAREYYNKLKLLDLGRIQAHVHATDDGVDDYKRWRACGLGCGRGRAA